MADDDVQNGANDSDSPKPLEKKLQIPFEPRRRQKWLKQYDLELWERQPEESDMAFRAFKHYLDQGEDRTVDATAAALKVTKTMVKRFAFEWTWKARILEWERYEWRQIRKARIREIKHMRERHAKIARRMLSKVAVRLAGEVQDKSKMIDAGELTAPQLAQWVEVAAKLERLSMGEPTEVSATLEQAEETRLNEAFFADPETRRALDAAASRIQRMEGDTGSDGGKDEQRVMDASEALVLAQQRPG